MESQDWDLGSQCHDELSQCVYVVGPRRWGVGVGRLKRKTESMKASFITTFSRPVNPIVLNKKEMAPRASVTGQATRKWQNEREPHPLAWDPVVFPSPQEAEGT